MKQNWKPGNLLYPLPAIMLSCAAEGKKPNIITLAWVGTVCSEQRPGERSACSAPRGPHSSKPRPSAQPGQE